MTKKRRDWVVTAAASLLLSITFFVFGPIQLFITNISEFWFSINDIWWICAVCGFISTALLVGIYFLLPSKIKDYYCSLVFGAALALYIQGNYIPMNYGSLNGDSIDWKSYTAEGIESALIWLVCIGGIVLCQKIVKTKTVKRVILYGSSGILAVQIITLGVLIATTNFHGNISYSLSTKNEFTLSKENNTLVFVLDCYDSKVFHEFIEEYPEYKTELFGDFTYYPNTVGGATRTMLALPYILTAYPYTNGESYPEYIAAGYKNTALYESFQKEKYDIGIYTTASYVSEDMLGIISNVESERQTVKSYPILAKKLFQFTACRYFPQCLKPLVWMYSGDFNEAAENVNTYVINDGGFYAALKSNGLHLGDRAGSFRLYHLMGAHTPYTLDAEAQPQGSTSLEEQQKGVMTILREYFAQMKDMGIYDSANIIVMSDHGEGGIEYNPLFLIKDASIRNDGYTVSDIPVSYSNLHPTILDWLGDNTTGIKAVKELQETDNQERLFYQQVSDEGKPYVKVYRIIGTIPKNETVEEIGCYPIMNSAQAKQLELGETIYFDIRATGTPYIVSGFRGTDTTHTWTLGEKSELSLPLSGIPNSDLAISIDLWSRITDTQRVGITVNREFLGVFLVTDHTLTFRVPNEIVKENLDITLDLPDAISPAELNDSATDHSQLSLAFRSLAVNKWADSMQETEKCSEIIGETSSILFSEQGNCKDFIVSGWYDQERNHRWTSGKAAISVIWDADKTYLMKITGNVYPYSGTVNVLFNGVKVAVLQGQEFEPILLTSELAHASRIQTITFSAPDATSPKAVGESNDARTLGVAVTSIEFDVR